MNNNCTVYKTAEFVGKRWTILIMLEIYKGHGKRRYSELKKALPGITPKILSMRLKELESQALIKKEIDSSAFPVKCEYQLTESGIDFIHIIQDLKKWALRWKFDNPVCESTKCDHCYL